MLAGRSAQRVPEGATLLTLLQRRSGHGLPRAATLPTLPRHPAPSPEVLPCPFPPLRLEPTWRMWLASHGRRPCLPKVGRAPAHTGHGALKNPKHMIGQSHQCLVEVSQNRCRFCVVPSAVACWATFWTLSASPIVICLALPLPPPSSEVLPMNLLFLLAA